MTDDDLHALTDDHLAKVLAAAERTEAQCEPLRWKHDEGWVLWSDARALVRRFSAEMTRRVSVDLDELGA